MLELEVCILYNPLFSFARAALSNQVKSIDLALYFLQRATGAVLVSQEPSKIILHRGWGAGDKHRPGQSMENKTIESGSTPTGQENKVKTVISPELITAIKLECGLEFSRGEKTVR